MSELSGFPSLHLEHLDDLRRSGLSPDTITMMGVSSVRPEDLNRLAGWDITTRGVTSALRIPYPGCDSFYQLKVFPAFDNGDGHTVRYIQPRESEPRAYVLPCVRARLQDPRESAIIVEDVKKAARLTQDGFDAVGIGAVWNWKAGSKAVPYTNPACLISDLKAIATPGRRILPCFDGDVWRRDRLDCRLALYALGKHLERAGAIVRVVRLPLPSKQERQAGITKIGPDDYLLHHSLEDFRRLLVHAIPLTDPCLADAARLWAKKEQAARPLVEPICSPSVTADSLRRNRRWRSPGSCTYWRSASRRSSRFWIQGACAA